ncbi:hypothetical protein pb186bvf_014473 [Paramecium bursaria]
MTNSINQVSRISMISLYFQVKQRELHTLQGQFQHIKIYFKSKVYLCNHHLFVNKQLLQSNQLTEKHQDSLITLPLVQCYINKYVQMIQLMKIIKSIS